jgi:hypothetical protein
MQNNTLFKTITGTVRAFLYHKKIILYLKQLLVLLELFCIIKNNTLFKTITGTAGGLQYHKK